MTRVHAIRVHRTGGPEELRYEEVELGAPGPGEALVRHTAIGLNFTDIHFRTGRYPLPSLPHVIGMEAAGVVEDGRRRRHRGQRRRPGLLRVGEAARLRAGRGDAGHAADHGAGLDGRRDRGRRPFSRG